MNNESRAGNPWRVLELDAKDTNEVEFMRTFDTIFDMVRHTKILTERKIKFLCVVVYFNESEDFLIETDINIDPDGSIKIPKNVPHWVYEELNSYFNSMGKEN